jgi:hypothetical protein
LTYRVATGGDSIRPFRYAAATFSNQRRTTAIMFAAVRRETL